MAGDFGWKSVELQVETLIPGILLAAETKAIAQRWFAHSPATEPWMPSSDFGRAALFVAVAYALGLISSMVTRALVDGISERGPRALVFSCFAHAPLDALLEDRGQVDSFRFTKDYELEKRRRWLRAAAGWNAVYRSTVRTTSRREEVDRRRSQGRLVRNLFFVLVLAPAALFKSIVVIAALAAVAAITAVALYAYAEYVIFAEAYDISTQQSAPNHGIQPTASGRG